MKKFLLAVAIIILFYAIGQNNKILPRFTQLEPKLDITKQTIVYEESVITKVVADSLPSVVTVGIIKTTQEQGTIQINPFDPFGQFRQIPGQKKKIDQNIGSGFIVSTDGLIITNKHVVADTTAEYKILLNDSKKYNVEKIYRDPLNDLAILKITAIGLKPLPLGDSSKIKLGQLAIAIGTPLGEFTNTVTSGIVSGLGRGITAGSPFEGFVEKLDNVIQTDAAISPGNSGGPLLNSAGQVIGINTAIAQEGQNIGFAIPVNVVKLLLENFKNRGNSFERPYIGVRYKMIDKQTAILNDVVEGAYIIEVIDNSSASKAGIKVEDILIEFDGKKVQGTDDQSLAKMILVKKVGDTVPVKIWTNKEIKNINITLTAAE